MQPTTFPKPKLPELTVSADARMTKEGPLAVIAVTGFPTEDEARDFARNVATGLITATKLAKADPERVAQFGRDAKAALAEVEGTTIALEPAALPDGA